VTLADNVPACSAEPVGVVDTGFGVGVPPLVEAFGSELLALSNLGTVKDGIVQVGNLKDVSYDQTTVVCEMKRHRPFGECSLKAGEAGPINILKAEPQIKRNPHETQPNHAIPIHVKADNPYGAERGRSVLTPSALRLLKDRMKEMSRICGNERTSAVRGKVGNRVPRKLRFGSLPFWITI